MFIKLLLNVFQLYVDRVLEHNTERTEAALVYAKGVLLLPLEFLEILCFKSQLTFLLSHNSIQLNFKGKFEFVKLPLMFFGNIIKVLPVCFSNFIFLQV